MNEENKNGAENTSSEASYDERKDEIVRKTTRVLKLLFVILAAVVLVMLFRRMRAEKKEESDTTLYIQKNAEKHVSSLGKYKGIEYTKRETHVTDEEINEKIQEYVTRGIRYEKVEDRQGTLLEPGDIVNCSYVASKDGTEIESKSGLFEIGSGKFAEFEKAIIGHFVGDTVEFIATVPADYETADDKKALEGEKLTFSVTINYVCLRYVPELDDSLAVEISKGACTTVEGLHDYFYEKMTKERETAAMAEIKEELLSSLIESSSFENLDGMLEKDFGKMKDYYPKLAEAKQKSLEAYLKEDMGTEPVKWETEVKEMLLESIKERLVLQRVADKEDLKVKKNSKEYKEMIGEYLAAENYTDEKQYLEDFGEETVLCNMTYELAIKFIMSTAVQKS